MANPIAAQICIKPTAPIESCVIGAWIGSSTLHKAMERMMQSAEMGALPTLRAAVDQGAKGGDYYGPSRMMESVGPPIKVNSNDLSHDEAVAKQLWDVSEAMTGVKYLDV